MPQSKERHAKYMREKRQGSREGSQAEGSQDKGSQDIEIVPQSYVQGITGEFKSLPERPRFLKLSDGQVLDRLMILTPNKSGDQAMKACNEGAYNYHPNVSNKERVKELIKSATK